MSNEFRDRLLTVGVISKRGDKPGVKEYKDPVDGHRIKATTDEHSNIVTEHATKDDRVDVTIKAPTTRMKLSQEEVPHHG